MRWEYGRHDGSRRVDIVGDLGGTVTISIGDGTYVLSHQLAGGETRSASGTLAETGQEWIDFHPAEGAPERVGFRRAAGTLALRSEHSSWDFTGGGEESAEFTAVLVRI